MGLLNCNCLQLNNFLFYPNIIPNRTSHNKIWEPSLILRPRGVQRPPPKPHHQKRRKEEVVVVARPKKKWSKGKTRDKPNNLVLFDKNTYDKLLKEVPTYKLITPSIVSERLKVRGSLARKALVELVQKGLIKQVVQHSAQTIYTRVTKDEETE